MVADTHLAHAERAQDCLCRPHLVERLHRNRRAVRDAAGEAGHGWLFPRRQTHLVGEFADFVLGHTKLKQWAAHPVVRRRSAARPPVAGVVRVRAINHDRVPGGPRDRFEQPVEFVLAVEAAHRAVRNVLGVVHLVSLDELVFDADERRQLGRFLALGFGHGRGKPGDCTRPATQGLLRKSREQRGIDPAAEGHHHPRKAGEFGDERRSLFGEFGHAPIVARASVSRRTCGRHGFRTR